MPLPDRNPNTGAPPPSWRRRKSRCFRHRLRSRQRLRRRLRHPNPHFSAPHVVLDDTPLPDPNPNRKATLPIVMKGTLTPAIQAPVPGMDYVAVLKPLTDVSA